MVCQGSFIHPITNFQGREYVLGQLQAVTVFVFRFIGFCRVFRSSYRYPNFILPGVIRAAFFSLMLQECLIGKKGLYRPLEMMPMPILPDVPD